MLRSYSRGASLSVTPPAHAPPGLRPAGYGATAKSGVGGADFSMPVFQISSAPAGMGEGRHAGKLDFWKTEIGGNWKSFLGKIDFGLQR